ncbi:BsuPI-related putative proteinase inhibitor [Planococcus sp. FY231025]|uniref:BsuPI-related putative proteinase inhibitor n=1 Tax=Planococcus sp. FY231025 TaxID=3455699 RepID=UPI003F900F5B
MQKFLWLGVWLLLALFLAACGTTESANEEPDLENGSSGGITAGEVVATIEQLDDDSYRYTLKNQTEEAVTFDFTSGQRYDFALYNENDEQVFLFSSVSTYTQALGEETIKQAEELSYEFDVPQLDLAAGTYKIEAWLTPKQGPAYPVETEYTIQ